MAAIGRFLPVRSLAGQPSTQADEQGGRWSAHDVLASRSRPWPASGTHRQEELETQRDDGAARTPRQATLSTQRNARPRRQARTSSPASTQEKSPSRRSGSSRRRCSAERYRDRVEAGSSSWGPTVSARHSGGCDSHGTTPSELNPNGGVRPSQGSGTRQPSRPRTVRPERSQVGSWRTSSGRSSTSGSPSSSPWYR